jgi:catecholate siderophore receptor
MSSVRVPGSLRRGVCGTARKPQPSAPKKELKQVGLFTAALLAAASPLSIAVAQGNLPPLSVEAKQAKKKATTTPKAPSGQAAPTDVADDQPPAQAKDANPYANPNAPYNVERSGSGKLTEPLAKTPRTVSVIPQEVIEDKGVTSIRELARQTPGVSIGFAEGGSAFGDAVYIRGFKANNDYFVDSMRDPGNGSREIFAVQQVEIYKGPSGSIAGRGTPGGAVNIITKKPNEEYNFYNLSTMFGTDHTFRTWTDINQVITPNFAVRANLMYNHNEVANRDFAEDERWGGQFAATWRLTETFKVTLDYYRLRSDGIPDWGVPINRTTLVPWTENGLPRSTWYGNINRDYMKTEADIVTAKAEWKVMPGITITSQTRMGQNSVDYIASTPRPLVPPPDNLNINNAQRYQEVDLFAHQTDATFKFTTGAWKHTLVTGVEFSRDEVGRYNNVKLDGTALATVTNVPIFNPDPNRPPQPHKRAFVYDATVDTKAAYIQDTIKLNEFWTINGGVRVDNFSREQVAATAAQTATREDTLVSYNLGVAFHPFPNATFYAAMATAANPIGSELDSTGATYSGLTNGTSILDPEEITGIEVGTKWQLFNKRLLATAALFQTEKRNARENNSACNDVTQVCTAASTGAYRVRGFELGAAGNITEHWSIYGGLVVMETEVTESANPAFVGRRMANIPSVQFSLLSKYRLTENLTVGGQAIYSSEVYNGFFAAGLEGYHTVPYWRFDALAEYKFTDHFSAQLNVINLTNELYYDALYQQNNAFVYVAPGRAAYLTLNWKY